MVPVVVACEGVCLCVAAGKKRRPNHKRKYGKSTTKLVSQRFCPVSGTLEHASGILMTEVITATEE